jgi:hypothetical protein
VRVSSFDVISNRASARIKARTLTWGSAASLVNRSHCNCPGRAGTTGNAWLPRSRFSEGFGDDPLLLEAVAPRLLWISAKHDESVFVSRLRALRDGPATGDRLCSGPHISNRR